MQYNQPFDQPSNPNASYVDGNPAAGIQGSIVPAASIEFPQREIMNAIQAAGLVGTNADLNQLLEMMKIMDVFNHFKVGAPNLGSATQWSTTVPTLPIMPPPFGTAIWFKAVYPSAQGGTVFSVNGSSFMPVANADLTPIAIGDVLGTGWLLLFFDGTRWLIVAGTQGRVPGTLPLLQKNTNWYVNGTTGNDTYDGTSPTFVTGKIGPFLTIQRASDEVLKYNMNNYAQIINIADGTYTVTQPVYFRPLNGTGTVYVKGNSANPQNVTVQVPAAANLYSCFYQTGGFYDYDGLRFTTGAGQLDGITVTGGNAQFHNLHFGPCARFHIAAGQSGTVVSFGNGTITIESGANAAAHIRSEDAAFLTFPVPYPAQWPLLNILGPVTFSSCFVTAATLGIAQMHYTSITGKANVTGPMWSSIANAVVDSYQGGASYFPGNAAGVASSGGQYMP
jgi:hypothetical protein